MYKVLQILQSEAINVQVNDGKIQICQPTLFRCEEDEDNLT